MSECKQFESEIAAVLAEDGFCSKPLEAHLEGCAPCRALMDMHRDLDLLESDEHEATDAELARIRRNVLRQAEREPPGTWRGQRPSAKRFFFPVVAAAAALAIGFVWGEWAAYSGWSVSDQIQSEARANRFFADAENSPYAYSNISFSRLDGDRIALGFDVATHVELVSRKDDPVVKEVMVQSLLNPVSINARLKAVGFAREIMNPKVKSALLFSLRNDPNVAVRLKAISVLAEHSGDPEIEGALLEVLKHETQVQLRLEALGYLRGTNRQGLEKVLSQLDRPEDAPLLLHAGGSRL